MRQSLLAIVHLLIMVVLLQVPQAASAQTISLTPDGCACEEIDYPEPPPCSRHFLPYISR